MNIQTVDSSLVGIAGSRALACTLPAAGGRELSIREGLALEGLKLYGYTCRYQDRAEDLDWPPVFDRGFDNPAADKPRDQSGDSSWD